jgi:hypothetical protein
MTFSAENNPELFCIQVDDSAWSVSSDKWHKDTQTHYSEDCGYTSVDELIPTDIDFKLFPNPADKYFVVSFDLAVPQDIVMTLTDLSGIVMKEFKLQNISSVNEKIDVSRLSAGFYFLIIQTTGGTIIKKVIIE